MSDAKAVGELADQLIHSIRQAVALIDGYEESTTRHDAHRYLGEAHAIVRGLESKAAALRLAASDVARCEREEVEAWRAAEHLRRDEPHAEFMTLAEARAATDAARVKAGEGQR